MWSNHHRDSWLFGNIIAKSLVSVLARGWLASAAPYDQQFIRRFLNDAIELLAIETANNGFVRVSEHATKGENRSKELKIVYSLFHRLAKGWYCDAALLQLHCQGINSR
jgi:hypothetical protein